MPNLTTTCVSMGGGLAAIPAVPAITQLIFGGTWVTGDKYSVIVTDVTTGGQVLFGAGNATAVVPLFALTYGNRVNVVGGSTDYMSAIGQPTVFNSLTAAGASYLTMSDWLSTSTSILSAVPYQGKLAFFSRWNVQIWNVNADPLQWSQQQVLANIGTIARNSVQSLGDLDVLFLSDTGLRSLRVRDSSLNAYVADIGSPIDDVVQTSIQTAGSGVGASMAVVEPMSGRYWCFVGGTIYVLSYYPNSKIIAWGTYLPTYSTLVATNPYEIFTEPLPQNADFTLIEGEVYTWTAGSVFNKFICGTFEFPIGQSGSFVASSTAAVAIANTNGAYDGSLVGVSVQTFTFNAAIVYQGQVYIRDANKVLLYGGTDNQTYDASVATVGINWLDLKTPGTLKLARSVDADVTGEWLVFCGMDQLNEKLDVVVDTSNPTYQTGEHSYNNQGFHFSMMAQTVGATAATMSAFLFHYNLENEK